MNKLLFCLALLTMLGVGTDLRAEETRHGQYIYVPAQADTMNSSSPYTLRAERILAAEEGETPASEPLEGAEFGVYVVSAEGELVPWANPLFLTEPMRLRSGMEPVHFALPVGMDFYLKQETAPEGVVFDETALIPVTGGEILVTNTSLGELRIGAFDSLGKPIPGIKTTAEHEDGTIEDAVTDQTGLAVFSVSATEILHIEESALPAGVYPAIRAQVSGETADPGQVTANVAPGRIEYVGYVHPTTGNVRLQMKRTGTDARGETVSSPLPGVVMRIDGLDEALITDEEGSAELALLEGRYTVTFESPDDGLLLPVARGSMIVSSGSTTLIELAAKEKFGRIRIKTDLQDTSQCMISVRDAMSGVEQGQFSFDAEGIAVTEALTPGDYIISLLLPDGVRFRAWKTDGETSSESMESILTVAAGETAEGFAELSPLRKRTMEVYVRRLQADGSIMEARLDGPLSLELAETESGAIAGRYAADKGSVALTAADGEYTARIPSDEAERYGLLEESEPFDVSDEADGSIFFREDKALLAVRSTDADGNPLGGAVYQLTDASGGTQTIVCDASGYGVSAPMDGAFVTLQTVTSPEGYDFAEEQTVTLEPGAVREVLCVHLQYGTVRIGVSLQKLDANAAAMAETLTGVPVYVRSEDPAGGFLQSYQILPEEGNAIAFLAPGEYLAYLEDGTVPGHPGEPVAFAVENESLTEISLIAYDDLGGVRAILKAEELTETEFAQFRFSAEAEDGERHALRFMGNETYAAAGLAPGSYRIVEEQAADGYSLMMPKQVTVLSGRVTEISVPLEETARLSVSKLGITFSRDMATFMVPISGEYAVYTMEDGQFRAYPSAEEQLTVWANVDGGSGLNQEIMLPATEEGTVYYLGEKTASAGFLADPQMHEITVHAGETIRPEFVVATDRGFFSVFASDAKTGENLTGGRFELMDETGKSVAVFSLEDGSYQSETAIPVGSYLLRQTEAPEGYALPEPADLQVEIRTWMSAEAMDDAIRIRCARIPDGPELGVGMQIWENEAEDARQIGIQTGSVPAGMRLAEPEIVIVPETEDGMRVAIGGVTVSGTEDAEGRPYRARIEYALRNGGWQPSRAIVTERIATPVTAIFPETEEIEAVRITFIDDESGEEKAGDGFAPGLVLLSAKIEGEGAQTLHVTSEMHGVYLYRAHSSDGMHALRMTAQSSETFRVEGQGVFGAESGGTDGSIRGTAFLDTDGNGVCAGTETGRYAGMTVRLLSADDTTLDVTRTDANGCFAFSELQKGRYRLQFDAGDALTYSSSAIYSDHVISHVTEARSGLTDWIAIDASHTDYIRNAGCIYAACLSGSVIAEDDAGETGMGGIAVALSHLGFDSEEPIVTTTDETGTFEFRGLVPGTYRVEYPAMEGYLYAGDETLGTEADRIQLRQGENALLGEHRLVRSASVSGMVWFDADGDGYADDLFRGIGGVQVTLLTLREGNVQKAAETVTDEEGRYLFKVVLPDTYEVQFELPEEFAFTVPTEESSVKGTAGRTGSSQAILVRPGASVRDVDAGITSPCTLEIRAFADEHGDGVWGPYDAGLSGVRLQLVRQEEGEDADTLSASTDENGNAAFDEINPGTYVVAYEMPGQWRTTKRPENKRANSTVSEVAQSSERAGRSDPFRLSAGESGSLVIGAMLTGSISGGAFEKADAASGERKGIPGIRVELLQRETALRYAHTDDEGAYAFEGLASGQYTVRFTAPEGYGFIETGRALPDGTAASVQARPVTLMAGRKLADTDVSLTALAAIRGTIWEDRDADGDKAERENAIADASVDLMNGSGRIILQNAKTDAQGEFAFGQLLPGTYRLRILPPDGYTLLSDAQDPAGIESRRGKYGYSKAITVLPGETSDTARYAMLLPGEIAGRIWQDDDYDGIMGTEEGGLRSVSVALLDASGQQKAAAYSDRNGEFSFGGLMPGPYSLRILLPEGYQFTAGGEQSALAFSGEREGVLNLGTLSMGEKMDGILIGVLPAAGIEGTVWQDEDDDGRFRAGEKGLEGVSVILRMKTGPDAGKEQETVTDANGAYRFDTVMPGEAALRYELPEGNAFARNAQGRLRVSTVRMADASVSESDGFTVAAGARIKDRDVGSVRVGGISGTVFEKMSADADALKRPLPDVRIQLLDDADGTVLKETETDEDGRYEIPFVRRGQYRMNALLPDGMIFSDGDSSVFGVADDRSQTTDSFPFAIGETRMEENAFAIRASSVSGKAAIQEGAGLAGTVVSLMRGGTVLRTAVTDESGQYRFDLLRPGETYRIRYTLPADALFADGTSLQEQYGDATEGEAPSFVPVPGESRVEETVYAVPGSAVTGNVWLDQNADGRISEGETWLEGVTVQLCDGEKQVLLTASTNRSGAYRFARLRAGTYTIRFTLPEGMLFADRLEGAGTSSVEPAQGSEACSEPFSLTASETKENLNAGAIEPGAIGDTVWLDENGNGLQDYREPLLPGVPLLLSRLKETGEVEMEIRTESDAYGYYRFEALRPGRYRLSLPADSGAVLTVRIGAPLVEIDSDLDPETRESSVILLQSGQTLLNVDVGLAGTGE